MHDHIFTTRERFALFGLAIAQAFLLLLILLPAPRHSEVLRVAAPARERVQTRLSPYGPGFEQELLTAFCTRYGYELRWVKADDRAEALRLVADGYADVAVGFGAVAGEDGESRPGPAALDAAYGDGAAAPPPDAAEADAGDAPGFTLATLLARLAPGADKTPPSGLVASPAYDHARPVLVRWPEVDPATPANAVDRDRGDGLRSALLLTSWETPGGPVLPGLLHPAGGPATSNAPGTTDAPRHAVIAGDSWRLWQPFVAEPTAGRATGKPLSYRWHWRGDDAPLAPRLAEFWRMRMAPADTLLDDLTERYFGFLPESLGMPDDGDYAGTSGYADIFDLMDLMTVVAEKLPSHAPAISRASAQSGIDPLLLSAVIFQESRFDTSARSKTGVRGIMQLTQSTALLLKVNRMNPSQSIRGGARYLRMLWESLDDLNLDPWDRWFFTLAAFNQGPGHLRDAIRLNRDLGGSGRTWRELKDTFPKLARPRYHVRTRYGYCRGYEAVAFVESVRYYYYILNGLVALSRPEAEHLAPLLGTVPVRWPSV
ncbi:transglycosylase SLT domain-containing protein [Nitratidesulfovibrio sp. HK-II]|uniref:transglycosylase SLT domain-containing protein n=1 Tax=Nitratidesulfovibrio sp. HK-II TaxID=2009266 RepID=UPI000E2FD8AE|nr:transglycosylase SLT domain-containing protein [Nitratidesulfovibrio sp. HK-II]GBO97589.1 transglycosylase SLT domain protein [Nitratidesulfovibrio sp. HK-II]